MSNRYNPSLCLGDIESSLPFSVQRVLSKLYKCARGQHASSMMESDRRILEIMLALSALNIDKKYGAVICIDERWDKDCLSTHRKLSQFLKELIGTIDFDLQFIICTHSRGVLQSYNERVIVMNKGQLYHIGS